MNVSNLGLFLLSVIAISLSGVMMPGPVTAVTVTKGYKDKNAGALIALGHGIIEFPLIAAIYLGFGQFFTSPVAKTAIGLVGGLMLIYTGLLMFNAMRKGYGSKDLPYTPLVAGILTTAANPYFFLWWATVGAALVIGASAFGSIGLLLFALSHWLCDLIWGLFVSVTVFKSKGLWGKKAQYAVFGGCAIILVGFGAWFILSAV